MHAERTHAKCEGGKGPARAISGNLGRSRASSLLKGRGSGARYTVYGDRGDESPAAHLASRVTGASEARRREPLVLNTPGYVCRQWLTMATNQHSCDSSVAIVQATRNSECVESIETSTHRWRRSDPAPVGRSVCVRPTVSAMCGCAGLLRSTHARSERERLGPTRAGGGDRDVDSATRGRAGVRSRGSRGAGDASEEGSDVVRRWSDARRLPTARRRGCLPMLLYVILNTHTSNLSRFTHSDCNGSPIRTYDLINYTRDWSGG